MPNGVWCKPRPQTFSTCPDQSPMFRAHLLHKCCSHSRCSLGSSSTVTSLLWRDANKHVSVKRCFSTSSPDQPRQWLRSNSPYSSSFCTHRTTARWYSFFSSSDTVFALSSGHGKCGEYCIIFCMFSSDALHNCPIIDNFHRSCCNQGYWSSCKRGTHVHGDIGCSGLLFDVFN